MPNLENLQELLPVCTFPQKILVFAQHKDFVIVDTDVFQIYKERYLTKTQTLREELGYSAIFVDDGQVILYCMNRYAKIAYYCWDS